MSIDLVSFPNATVGYDFGQASYNSGQRPAFQHSNGKYYAFVAQDSPAYASRDGDFNPLPDQDNKLHCISSIDGTSWAELDAAHAPSTLSVGGPAHGFQYSLCVDGDTAVIFNPLWDGFDTVSGLCCLRFNLASGTWGTTTTLSNVVSTVTHGAVATFSRILVLSPGNYLVYFSGASVTVGGTPYYGRVYCATFNGTTLGTPVLVADSGSVDPQTYAGHDAVIDSSGRVYFFYFRLGRLQCVIRKVDGTLTVPVALPDAQGYWANFENSTFSNALVYASVEVAETIGIAGELSVLDHDGFYVGTQSLTLYHAPVGDSLSWTKTDLWVGNDNAQRPYISGWSTTNLFPIPNTYTGGITPSIQLAHGANTLILVWSCPTDSSMAGQLWESTSPDASLSWSAPSLLATVPTIPRSTTSGSVVTQLCMFPTDAGVGIVTSSIDLQGDGVELSMFGERPMSLPEIPAALYYPQINSNHIITQLPYATGQDFGTVVQDVETGMRWAFPRRGSGLAGFPDGPLSRFMVNYPNITDAEVNTLYAFFKMVQGPWGIFGFLDPAGNMLKFSEAFDNPAWAKSMSPFPGIPDPYGNARASILSAGTLTLTAVSGPPSGGLANYVFCASIWIAGDVQVTAEIGFRDETTHSVYSTTYSGILGWVRIHHTLKLPTNNQFSFYLNATCAGSFYVFGAQVSATKGEGSYVTTPGLYGVHPKCRFEDESFEVISVGPNQNQLRLTIQEVNA